VSNVFTRPSRVPIARYSKPGLNASSTLSCTLTGCILASLAAPRCNYWMSELDSIASADKPDLARTSSLLIAHRITLSATALSQLTPLRFQGVEPKITPIGRLCAAVVVISTLVVSKPGAFRDCHHGLAGYWAASELTRKPMPLPK